MRNYKEIFLTMMILLFTVCCSTIEKVKGKHHLNS